MPVLDIRDLRVTFQTANGAVPAVAGVSVSLFAGETLALVGESGSGKSALSLSILGLTAGTNVQVSGSVVFDNTDLLRAPERTVRRYRGRDIAMIFQDSLAALNPVKRVGDQVVEMIQTHQRISKNKARSVALEKLDEVGIANLSEAFYRYPHEFSGGMRQRVMIALALANAPDVLIADEPTTALDVTIQAQIMRLLKKAQDRYKTSILLVTHDLGVVNEVADRVAVMYSGRLVEIGDREQVLYKPRHPYTPGLMESTPHMSSTVGESLRAIPGAPPLGAERPTGCAFAPRCEFAHERCSEIPPLRRLSEPDQAYACWL